jgi:hypothetical protein
MAGYGFNGLDVEVWLFDDDSLISLFVWLTEEFFFLD